MFLITTSSLHEEIVRPFSKLNKWPGKLLFPFPARVGEDSQIDGSKNTMFILLKVYETFVSFRHQISVILKCVDVRRFY